MKKIINIYHKLDNKTKDILEPLYILKELEDSLKDLNTIKVSVSIDEERFLELAMSCLYLTNLGADKIVIKILEIIINTEMTLEDLHELDTEELKDIMESDEDNVDENEDEKEKEIITEFFYKGLFCVLVKDKGKYILVYDEDGNTTSLIFNNLEEILSIIIHRDLVLSRAEL